MRATVAEIEGPAGETLPAVRLDCTHCGGSVPVYVYDGDIPPLIAPALRVLMERFQPEDLPGAYLCPECLP